MSNPHPAFVPATCTEPQNTASKCCPQFRSSLPTPAALSTQDNLVSTRSATAVPSWHPMPRRHQDRPSPCLLQLQLSCVEHLGTPAYTPPWLRLLTRTHLHSPRLHPFQLSCRGTLCVKSPEIALARAHFSSGQPTSAAPAQHAPGPQFHTRHSSGQPAQVTRHTQST